MCGLFGVIRLEGLTKADDSKFEALSQQLLHRGPDGSGFIRDTQVLLGMHRLSIMDPLHGWQPFWSSSGRWGVLGNGEIYNAVELRRDLESRGHAFATHSDIEVVPHLFEEFGPNGLSRLRGMFALIAMDTTDREVILARDAMGEKPLVYWQQNGVTYLSSEQSALVRSGLVSLEVDASKLPDYLLHGFIPEPLSLIRGVRKIPAAHYVRISLSQGTTSLVRYWDPRSEVGDADLSDAALSEAIRDAVVATTTSDVPVGIALSGGLDSSLITAMAKEAHRELSAVTVAYAGSTVGEAELARALARDLDMPCYQATLHTKEIARDFRTICGSRDEPISDIAGPALSAVARTAHEHGLPVLLTGIGGDELFWGYDWIRRLAEWSTRYLEEGGVTARSIRSRFTSPPATRQAQFDWLKSLGGVRTDHQLREFFRDTGQDNLVSLPFYDFQPGYETVLRAIGELCAEGWDVGASDFRFPASADWMPAAYTIASNETYLRVNSFVQIDRLSMAHSVESRAPLSDAQLISQVLSGRLRSRDHFDPPKQRMRRIAQSYLPPDVICRPKRGFTPPVRDWLDAIWLENSSALTGTLIAKFADVPPVNLQRWLKRPTFRSGRVNQVALRLLTLELWLASLD